MTANVLNTDAFSHLSTEELKAKLLQLTKGRDAEPLSQKVLFYKNELAAPFSELSRRNPFPAPEAQVPLIPGVWSPVWSTIPFQDSLPGRLREQSYQIFHENGYYANMARYAPGHKLSWLQKLSAFLIAYDLMVVQTFKVIDGQWVIQNVGIEQALRLSGIPLSIDKAEDWFTRVVSSKSVTTQKVDVLEAPNLTNLDKSTLKKFQKIFLAKPRLEHLYIDRDFRLVKTQREANQRPSYTIAVRRR